MSQSFAKTEVEAQKERPSRTLKTEAGDDLEKMTKSMSTETGRNMNKKNIEKSMSLPRMTLNRF